MVEREQRNQRDSLDDAIVETLESADLVPIVSEYIELGLDAALSDGILKDIPVVGSLISLTKVGLNVRDRIFVAKLVNFLKGLQHVPEEDRRGLVDRLQTDPGYGRSVGQHLIELLERLDGHRKPLMVARVFEAYLIGRIDIKLFNRLIYAIERIPFFEIDEVRQIYEQSNQGKIEASPATFHALENSGLVYERSGYGGTVYQANDLCQIFVELGLDRAEE